MFVAAKTFINGITGTFLVLQVQCHTFIHVKLIKLIIITFICFLIIVQTEQKPLIEEEFDSEKKSSVAPGMGKAALICNVFMDRLLVSLY